MLKLLQRLTVPALCLLALVLISELLTQIGPAVHVVLAHAQDGQTANTKTVLIRKMHDNDPLALMRIVDGTTLARGGDASEDDQKWMVPDGMPPRPTRPWLLAFRFEAGDDWLKNLSIYVADRTSEKIVRMLMAVNFPEVKQTSGKVSVLGAGVMIRFGGLPASVAYDTNGNPLHHGDEQSLELRSGYETPLSFARDEATLRNAVEKWQPFSTVSLCYVTFANVTFADGMSWGEAGYSRPDPDHPGRYILMDKNYFPAPAKLSVPLHRGRAGSR